MAFALMAGWGLGCTSDVAVFGQRTPGTGGEAGGGGQGGAAGGGGASSCAEDCSAIPGIPTCSEGLCDTEHEPPECIIVPSPADAECDDGKFCTVGDHCQDGMCVAGGAPNDCGQGGNPCVTVLCNEASDSCTLSWKPQGTACTPAALCEVSAACNAGGQCVGTPNDCSWTPVDACHVAVCDDNDGACKPLPANSGGACDANPCNLGGTCDASGNCAGTTPVDCSGLTVGCYHGVCELGTGSCVTEPGTEGDDCTPSAEEQCNDGHCSANLACIPTPRPNFTQCDDYNSCTDHDECTDGVCSGTAVQDCTTYFEQAFEGACPNGWTLAGDWQCGTPSAVGPVAAYSGTQCLGTIIAGNYNDNDTWAGTTATSPSMDLTTAVAPRATWRMWIHTEGQSYDGANLKVSTNDGASWQVVTAVIPAYGLTIQSEPAWGGDWSANGWQLYTADLTAFAGQPIRLRFAFRSDTTVVDPGVYIDDVRVAD
jgi:hypothetical protein